MDAAEKFAPFAQRSFEKRAAVQPKKIENDKSNRHVRGCPGEKIGGVTFASEALLQVEECEPATLFKGDDLSVDDQIGAKLSRLYS